MLICIHTISPQISSIIKMENVIEKRSRRQLRNNSFCTPFNNIFKDEGYIIKSGCQHLPEDIFKKISKFPTITCDQINSLTFAKTESHEHIVSRMKDALDAQKKMITSDLSLSAGEPGWAREPDQFRSIKSKDREYE